MTENCNCETPENCCENLCSCGVIYGDDVTWGNVGKDIIGSLFWEVYFNDICKGPDEVLIQNSTFEVSEEKVESDGVYVVTITPNEELKSTYPNALVNIDAHWYDLAKLDEPVELNVARDHRISIVWCPKTLVETFLIDKKSL